MSLTEEQAKQLEELERLRDTPDEPAEPKGAGRILNVTLDLADDAQLERAFKLKSGSLVEMLVADGRYVDDLSVDRIVERVEHRFSSEKRQA